MYAYGGGKKDQQPCNSVYPNILCMIHGVPFQRNMDMDFTRDPQIFYTTVGRKVVHFPGLPIGAP